MSVFCLDFDNTFTAAPELWTEFCGSAWEKGHRVICITARTNPDKSLVTNVIPPWVEAFFCLGVPKRKFAESIGIKVDVWIDDCPEAIVG